MTEDIWWAPSGGEALPDHDELQFIGAQVLGPDGGFSQGSVVIRDGVFLAEARQHPHSARVEASKLWLTPGFVDAHTHLAWRAFDTAEHEGVGDAQRREDVRITAQRTLQAGVTGVRDAGGLKSGFDKELGGLSAALSLQILGPADARGAAHLRGRVQEFADGGADWIKVAATGGVGAGESVLDPVFDIGELTAIHSAAERAGLPVMVHAWGGDALTWALNLGAASIEHAMLITPVQAVAAARQDVVIVPTVWIYQDVLAMVEAGKLPRQLESATRRAVGAHPTAIRHCLDAGATLAMGTDAGIDSQHGRNLHEVAAMIDAGVPPKAALVAATANGARLIGRPGEGVIRPGADADLVCFASDPSVPATLRDPSSIVAVFRKGRLAKG